MLKVLSQILTPHTSFHNLLVAKKIQEYTSFIYKKVVYKEARLFKKLRKFSTGAFETKESFQVQKCLKCDLILYKML